MKHTRRIHEAHTHRIHIAHTHKAKIKITWNIEHITTILAHNNQWSTHQTIHKKHT